MTDEEQISFLSRLGQCSEPVLFAICLCLGVGGVMFTGGIASFIFGTPGTWIFVSGGALMLVLASLLALHYAAAEA